MEIKKDIGLIIKEIRKSSGLTQAEFARRLGFSSSGFISEVESGDKMPGGEFLISLEREFGKGILSDLQSKQQEISSKSNHEYRENKTGSNRLSDRYVYLPLYDVEASAGHGSMIHSEQIIDHLAFLREWIQKELSLNPEKVLLIKAIGDSMTPTIKAGALLLVNMEVTKVRNDSIYIIRQNGDLLVKRVQNLMDGRVEIKSDNAEYKPIILQGENLDIIGEVVWGGQRF